MKSRIYFLDNLRTFLILLVVLLHTGLVFEPVLESSWIIINPEKINSLGLVRMYLDIFVMFSIFFISGYFVPMAATKKSVTGFIKSKFNRLMVPWLVSVLTLIPLYKVIFLYSRGLPQQPWYTYFHVFQNANGNMMSYADNPVQNWLWFLPVLFAFQLIYLALYKTGVFKLRISMRNAILLAMVVSFIYAESFSFFDLRGWYHSAIFHFQNERLIVYLSSFLLGSAAYKHKVFDASVNTNKLYIYSNVLLTISLSAFTIFALNLFFNMIDPNRNFFIINYQMDVVVYNLSLIIAMFSFLQIFLHIFKRYINKTNGILNRLSLNSYYVYIVHIPVIGLLGLVILNINVAPIIKYILLFATTYFTSNVISSLYRILLKNYMAINPVRYAVIFIALVISFNVYYSIASNNEQPTVMAEVTTQDTPTISIHEAAMTGNTEELKKHISSGTNINQTEPTGGSTPLISAALFGKYDAVAILIEAGADINYQNNDGSTALHTASFFCYPEIVSLLFENGAQTNIKNNSGSTPLQSVQAPMEAVTPIYQYLAGTLGPLGLNIDLEYIEKTRPVVVEIINSHEKKK